MHSYVFLILGDNPGTPVMDEHDEEGANESDDDNESQSDKSSDRLGILSNAENSDDEQNENSNQGSDNNTRDGPVSPDAESEAASSDDNQVPASPDGVAEDGPASPDGEPEDGPANPETEGLILFFNLSKEQLHKCK